MQKAEPTNGPVVAGAPLAFGVVLIGRNEGERLRRCIESIAAERRPVVYVDSGSSDNSISIAQGFGVEVVELDMSTPFCAARARNAGYQRLIEIDDQLSFVQFVDGDCELINGWLLVAATALDTSPDIAIVAGRLHERFPERSVYNRLGNLEWNFSGPGEVDAVGGIFMIRCAAFEGVGGFDSTVVAGEEPELCQRLVRQGWRLRRLDEPMAWHDLAMVRFAQWWKRAIRFGYGSADIALRFGLARSRRSSRRARLWTMWLFAVIVVGTVAISIPRYPVGPLVALILILLWPFQLSRIALRTWRRRYPARLAVTYAFFIMISQWPQMLGQALYWLDRFRNRSSRLVEYKVVERQSK